MGSWPIPKNCAWRMKFELYNSFLATLRTFHISIQTWFLKPLWWSFWTRYSRIANDIDHKKPPLVIWRRNGGCQYSVDVGSSKLIVYTDNPNKFLYSMFSYFPLRIQAQRIIMTTVTLCSVQSACTLLNEFSCCLMKLMRIGLSNVAAQQHRG